MGYLTRQGSTIGGRAIATTIAVIALLLIFATTSQATTVFRTIASGGPLTNIWLGNDLDCQIQHAGDPTFEFFPSDSAPGDCGTFVSTAGTLYGPDFTTNPSSATPFVSGTSNYLAFTPGSQSAVTGSGTAASPYVVTTSVTAGRTGLGVSQADSYVLGNEYYRTDITLHNSSATAVTGRLYRAGDCYLQGSDLGFGALERSSGGVACTQNANDSPAGLVEEFAPLTAGNHFVEDHFSTVWSDLALQADLPNTCQCSALDDNGAAIDWSYSIPARGSATYSSLTNFSRSGALKGSGGTPGVPSVVAGSGPVVVGSSGAGFSGSVVPDGFVTTAHFEYGLDARYRGSGASGVVYDQSTPGQVVGSDFTAHAVSASASGLLPNALYHVRLVASNRSGTVFGPDQTFRTGADKPPPEPVLGKAVNVAPVSGVVFIRPPAGKSLAHFSAALARAALTKGNGFVALTEARQIPTGSQIDSRQGSLQVTTASVRKLGKPQVGTFAGGVFKLTQARARVSKGLATLTLLEGAFSGAPSYTSCTATGKAAAQTASAGPSAQTAKLSSQVLQTLNAKDHGGHFRTRGRYSAGTVRGTEWSTQDQCNGTLTIVRRGTVSVQDFARRTTITVHAGQRYLAKP